MADTSMGLHEQPGTLHPATIDRHRAIVSLMEELEAVDWYDQRVDAAGDPSLAGILAHNRDEEKEHAAMTLEWLRRHDPALDAQLRTYLFTSGPILSVEAEATGGNGGGAPTQDRLLPVEGPMPATPGRGDGSLGIGGLRSVTG
ncbi:ferritin-like domain-containing protein [Frankia sp. Cr1]|uniref:ferritin-like domain-containing protein n=1 Tax=Frankia sp. Cr1 TaxID=3073931 RepID=UPI002AD3A152|nr:ferritin-like domain-containing protein [Frankia sp. Cr1]